MVSPTSPPRSPPGSETRPVTPLRRRPEGVAGPQSQALGPSSWKGTTACFDLGNGGPGTGEPPAWFPTTRTGSTARRRARRSAPASGSSCTSWPDEHRRDDRAGEGDEARRRSSAFEKLFTNWWIAAGQPLFATVRRLQRDADRGGDDRAHDGDAERAADLARRVEHGRADARPVDRHRAHRRRRRRRHRHRHADAADDHRGQELPVGGGRAELREVEELRRRAASGRRSGTSATRTGRTACPVTGASSDDQASSSAGTRRPPARPSSRARSACRARRRRRRRTSPARRAASRCSRPCRSRCGRARRRASARARGARSARTRRATTAATRSRPGCGGGPAVRVRLDQRVLEREQADRRT